MQLTMLLLLVCQVFGQYEDDIYRRGERDDEGQVSILSHQQELGEDGTFKYSFSADNGLQQKEAFHPDGSRTGAYSYVDPQGETVLVQYRADRFGFHILDGSSIPTTPPLAGRSLEHPSKDDDGSRDSSGPGASSYEVEEHDGKSSASADKKSLSTAALASRPLGFELSRSQKTPGYNRYYRSPSRKLFSEGLVPAQSDVYSVATEDLNSAASSYHFSGLTGYRVEQKKTPLKSPYASLARQTQYPASRKKTEAQVEDGNSSDRGVEQTAATDNGDYSLHAGRHDDGSYPQHAVKYDDGSYPQHAVKYDDGSYDKYTRLYGEGPYDEPQGHYGNDDFGQAEYEAGYVRQPGEAEVSHE